MGIVKVMSLLIEAGKCTWVQFWGPSSDRNEDMVHEGTHLLKVVSSEKKIGFKGFLVN